MSATEAARRMEIYRQGISYVSDMLNEGLLPDQVTEHQRIAQTKGPDAANAYLREVLPNYDELMSRAVDIFKEDFLAKQENLGSLTPFFESQKNES